MKEIKLRKCRTCRLTKEVVKGLTSALDDFKKGKFSVLPKDKNNQEDSLKEIWDNKYDDRWKVHLQCGYEDKCKNKDCLNCQRRQRYNLSLTLAEQIVIEDFAICDLMETMKDKPEEVFLMQEIMVKVMKKMIKEEGRKK